MNIVYTESAGVAFSRKDQRAWDRYMARASAYRDSTLPYDPPNDTRDISDSVALRSVLTNAAGHYEFTKVRRANYYVVAGNSQLSGWVNVRPGLRGAVADISDRRSIGPCDAFPPGSR